MSLLGNLRGKNAEQRAARYLRQQGLKILNKNKRYKCGEIDIIAADADIHIFVEVKYRQNNSFGAPAEMVSAAKQAKLTKAAQLWLQEHDPNFTRGCRFDVISISRVGGNESQDNVQWLKNAFSPELW